MTDVMKPKLALELEVQVVFRIVDAIRSEPLSMTMEDSSSKCEDQVRMIEFLSRRVFIFKISGQASYVAFALSYDDVMNRDSVIECVNDGGVVRAYSSFTNVENNDYSSPRIDVSRLKAESYAISYN